MQYKDKERGTWTVELSYKNSFGKTVRKKKRGFATKKDAKNWEVEFLNMASGSMEMSLKDFVEVYFKDKDMELKERSKKNKRYMIERHIIPFLGEEKMADITSAMLLDWQAEIMACGYSETYLRMIQNQMTALFTHACKIYDLRNNPCKKIKKMGKSDIHRLEFWTKDEYDKFISSFEEGEMYYVLFETLFWTGMRIGECLALTPADIDFHTNRINITKTYYRTDKRDIITTPKTEESVRVVDIPGFLTEELRIYIEKHYGMPKTERLFPIVQESVQHMMKNHIADLEMRKIPVHGLRHSNVAMLIAQGVQPMVIKERLGHKDIKITLNTYGHLYPNQQRRVADMLDNLKGSDDGNHQNPNVTAD